MHVQRLEHLREALLDLNTVKQRFVMPAGKSPDKFEFDFSTFGRLEPSCTTAACAVGMAAMLPEFQQEGLYYEVRDITDLDHNSGEGYSYLCIGVKDKVQAQSTSAFDAAALFFEIKVETSTYLFDPEYYPNGCLTSPGEIAARIEELLEVGEDTFIDRFDDYDDDEDDEYYP